MANIMIRNLAGEAHRAIKLEALAGGRSVEAQIRLILERAVLPEGRLQMGTLLREIGEQVGGVEYDMLRDGRRPLGPAGAVAL